MKRELNRIKSLLSKSRNYAQKTQESEYELFSILSDSGIKPGEIPTKAYNADNLEEAISCYISYGEWTENEIMEEIEDAMQRGKE